MFKIKKTRAIERERLRVRERERERKKLHIETEYTNKDYGNMVERMVGHGNYGIFWHKYKAELGRYIPCQ